MNHRSRIAPLSEAQALRLQRGKTSPRYARTTMRNVLGTGVLVGAAFMLSQLFSPAFFHERFVGAMRALPAAGEWAWALLAAAFRSIPVW